VGGIKKTSTLKKKPMIKSAKDGSSTKGLDEIQQPQ
jgi:hypothetical protein